jgi:chemotaxis protein methyltransferase CheR
MPLDKLNPRLYYLRAMILQEQGENDAAAAALRQALYLDPRHIASHLALGHLCLAQNRKADAQRHMGNARELLLKLDRSAMVPDLEDMPVANLLEMIGGA